MFTKWKRSHMHIEKEEGEEHNNQEKIDENYYAKSKKYLFLFQKANQEKSM